MTEFEKFVRELADHEEAKTTRKLDDDPRARLLVHAGVHLNWLGDFVANPDINWEKREIPVEEIEFSGTSPEWNKLLIDQAERSPEKLLQLMQAYPAVREFIQREVKNRQYRSKEIILRRSDRHPNGWAVLDGMPNFVEAVADGADSVTAWVPINEDETLPHCEAHVVYDLLRAFRRNYYEGAENDLEAALRFLTRTYANVEPLLRERFGPDRLHHEQTQQVVLRILN